MAQPTTERINLSFENLEYTATKWNLDGIFLKKGT